MTLAEILSILFGNKPELVPVPLPADEQQRRR